MNKNEQWTDKSREKLVEKKFRVFEGIAGEGTEEDHMMFELAMSFRAKNDDPYGEFTEEQLDNFIITKIAETPPAKKEKVKKLLAEIKDKILTNDSYLATEKLFPGFIKE